MNEHYLSFRTAGGEWLLAMKHVIEVGIAPALGNAAHYAWRERVLNVRHVAEILGSTRRGNETQLLVVHGAQGEEVLVVEAITGLLQVPASSLLPFAPTCPQTAGCVDAALARDDGRCALRLRWPLPA